MSLGLSMYNSSSESEEEATVKPVKTNKREKVKIFVPKVKHNSSDEDEPDNKKVKTSANSSARSGLFSKLPAPRNSIGTGKQPNRPLIPHVFSKPKPEKQTPQPTKHAKNEQSDDSDVSDSETNFFSYVEKVEIPDNAPQESEEVTTIVNPPVEESLIIPPPPPEEPDTASQSAVRESFPSGADQQWRKDEQFLRIQGKKNRKEKVEFIDVNADSALEGNKELLLKSISEERNMNRASHKNKDGPSALSKRKHQMSYLIHQAQAREIELKNAWAAGREARKAARMRYGF